MDLSDPGPLCPLVLTWHNRWVAGAVAIEVAPPSLALLHGLPGPVLVEVCPASVCVSPPRLGLRVVRSASLCRCTHCSHCIPQAVVDHRFAAFLGPWKRNLLDPGHVARVELVAVFYELVVLRCYLGKLCYLRKAFVCFSPPPLTLERHPSWCRILGPVEERKSCRDYSQTRRLHPQSASFEPLPSAPL